MMGPEMGMAAHGRPAEEALQQDVIYTIASMLNQDDLTSMRLASASFRQPLATCVKCVAPRTRASEELCRRYQNVGSVSLHRHKAVCSQDIRALAWFPRLHTLSLAGAPTQKRGEGLLAAISDLTSLTSLDLRGCNKLTWKGLSQLTSLTNLQFLNVTGVRYESDQYPAVSLHTLLSRLHSLILGDGCTLSYVDDDLLGRIGRHATSLTYLDCSGCIDITDIGLQALAPLAPNLKQLSLQSCVRLSQNGISSTMPMLPNLTTLNLRGCIQLFDDGLAALSVLTGLTELVVQGCSGIRGSGFAQLTPLKQLTVLNAKECGLLDSLTGIAWLSTVRRLNLSRCMSLKPDALIMLGHLCMMEELDMTGLNLPGRTPHSEQLDVDLERWLCVLSELKRLDLSHFQHPHGVPQGLLAAISNMTALTSLSLAGVNPPLCNHTATAQPSLCSTCSQAATRTASLGVPDSATASTAATTIMFHEDVVPCSGSGPESHVLNLNLAGAESQSSYEYNEDDSNSNSSYGDGICSAGQNQQACCSECGGDCGGRGLCSLQLSFLSDLDLVHLDLSGWTGLPPCALMGLTHLTGLKELRLGRLSNDCVRRLGGHAQQLPAAAVAVAMKAAGGRAWDDRSDDGSDSDGEEDGWRPRPVMPASAGPQRTFLSCTCDHTQPMPITISSCNSRPCHMDSAESCRNSSCSNSQVSQPTNHQVPLASHPLQLARCSHSSVESLEGHMAAWDITSRAIQVVTPYASCQPPQERTLNRDDAFNQCFNQSMVYVSYLKGLERLHLEACVLLEDSGLVSLVSKVGGGLPHLRSLHLGGCKRITGCTLAVVAQACYELTALSLEDCSNLEERHLIHTLPMLTSLTSLKLGGCGLLSDRFCEAMSHVRMSQLRTLNLRACTKVTTKGVFHLALGIPSLTSLTLSQCWAVDNRAVQYLASRARCLTHLDLKHCWRVSKGCLAEVARTRPLLTVEVVLAAWPLGDDKDTLAEASGEEGEGAMEQEPSVDSSEGGLSDSGEVEEEEGWGHLIL